MRSVIPGLIWLSTTLSLTACTSGDTYPGEENDMTVTVRSIQAGEFVFDVRQAGESGEPVILLHGFPETSHMWLPLLERLAVDGYQAYAPDQRGYSAGARPLEAAQYAYPLLAADVIGLADALGFDRFHLVGHDHGAGLGWFVTGAHPDRILSWTALSVPHIDAFGEAIANNAEQAERSEYMTFFRQEGTAEAALGANDFEALKAVWSESSPEQLEDYLRVFRQEGALTGALNWYRGALGGDGPRQPVGQIATPTLMIWGNQDQAIGRPGVDATPPLMSGPYEFMELDAGHWLIQEAEATVVDAVMKHIARNPR